MTRKQQMTQLREQRYTYQNIGDLLGISRQRVHQIITGIGYDSFLTGIEATRERIRARDNFTCQLCGKKWKKGERRLDVHHLDCDSLKTQKVEPMSEAGNMITLCHKCHLGVFHKRST